VRAVTCGFACQLRPELVEVVKWHGGMVSMIRSAAEAITASATVSFDDVRQCSPSAHATERPIGSCMA